LLQERLRLLQNFQAKSSVISNQIFSADIFTILESEGFTVINYLKVNGGVVIQSYNLQIKNNIDDTLEDVFSQAIYEIMERLKIKSESFMVNLNLEFQIPGVKYSIPNHGEKLKLLN